MGTNHKSKRHWKRDRWEKSQAQLSFHKKTKTAKSAFKTLGVPKEADLAQYFADVVRSLAG